MMDETNLAATRGQVSSVEAANKKIRNLNSLFHFCLGVGIRSPGYETEDREYEMRGI